MVAWCSLATSLISICSCNSTQKGRPSSMTPSRLSALITAGSSAATRLSDLGLECPMWAGRRGPMAGFHESHVSKRRDMERPRIWGGGRCGPTAHFYSRVPGPHPLKEEPSQVPKSGPGAPRFGLRCQMGLGPPALGSIQGHRSANQILQGPLVHLVAFAEVDGAPHVSLEAGI